MEIAIYQAKLLPGDVDLTCQVGKSGEYVCTADYDVMKLYPLIKRMKFYHPVSPDFKGTESDLKNLTCPGDGYNPDHPWCIFPRPYHYELDIFLDMTLHTVFDS